MPTLYEYFGLIIHFFANEHLPIHVHCEYQDRANKAEILFENGKVKQITILNIKGVKPLQEPQLTDFKVVVERNAEDIVKKWNDYFVLRKRIKKTIIKKRYRRVV